VTVGSTEPATVPLDPAAERSVALTDLALGLEAAVFAALLARGRDRSGRGLRRPLVVSMAATAVAALTGAALHGLTVDRTDARRRTLWRISLSSIGVAALSSWTLGARLRLAPSTARTLERVVTILHVPYFVAVATGERPYRLAVSTYLPGAIFLTAALATGLVRGPARVAAGLGLSGMGVTFLAAAVQVRRIGVGRRFDHNARYHTLQAGGIALLYAAGRRLAGRTSRP
jgi:Family of unknown function (DUF6962)